MLMNYKLETKVSKNNADIKIIRHLGKAKNEQKSNNTDKQYITRR